MMNYVIIFLSIISFKKHLTKATTTEYTTAPIETRIELLKRQLLYEIQEVQDRPLKEYEDDYSDMYEYVDNSNQPITPISIFDKRKLQDRFKLPELKSTSTAKYVASDTSPETNDEKPLRSKKRAYKKVKKTKPLEIFYRKMLFDDERNKPQKWTHCLDIITPFLNGYKDNDTNLRKIDASDHSIKRLSRLLSSNVTNSTKDEIRSILYQISNLQLRVFQWDITAVRSIFNVIIKNRTHDFKGLKYGLKDLFTRWKLDTSDVDTLMRQTKIFRPPCIQVSDHEGSTMTTNVESSKPTEKKCPDGVTNC